MKFRRYSGLRGIVLLSALLGGGCVFAQELPADKPVAEPAEPVQIPQPAPTGPNVVSVRVVTAGGKVLVDAPKGIPSQAGKPLNRGEVAASLRILYQTGVYADLQAVTTRVADGVTLDFIARENLFINLVSVEGVPAPPTEASAVASMQLSLGQTYHSGDVDEALDRLRDTLRDEGLYQAKVTAEQVPHSETHQMDIIAKVVAGPRVRLGKIDLINNTEYKDADLLSVLKLKPGAPLTLAKVQNAVERVRKFMEKRQHLSARVSVRRGEYDATQNTVGMTLDVTEGPRVLVEVEGAKISKSELRRLVPVYQEGSVDTDLLEEGKKNLRERVGKEGYFNATVDYTLTSREVQGGKSGWKGSQETILYVINRGDRKSLQKIEFLGNHYFATDVLRARLNITPSTLFTRPRFSQRLMEADAASMRNLYAANGFLSAKVDPQVIEDFDGKSGDLAVRFVIQEGKQTLVASLKIEGATTISEEELRNVVGSSPGQPYSDINVSADRDNILALYFNEGFPNAQFSARATAVPADQSTSAKPGTQAGDVSPEASQKGEDFAIERAQPMALVYTVVEGEQIHVKRVLLTGYQHARPKVIRREVKVTPGGPLREGDIVESQQKLYNLGIFNRVTIEPQNANGTEPDKDVVVLVEEAKRYTIAYGGGLEAQRMASTTNPAGGEFQASPRGIFEISKQDLTGRADSLSLKIRASTIQGRALLAYSAPNTFENQSLSMQATAYAEKTQDVNTFSQTRYEGNLQLTQQLSPRASMLYRYAFRKVTVSNLQIPPDEVPLFNQPTLISQFSVTWFRDTRDNPATTRKGTFNSADASIASTAIGSSASFFRLFVQNSSFTPIHGNWIWARSIRFGILEPFANTQTLQFPPQTSTPPPQVIPLPERLFSGGGGSLRGFGLNQAGPRDSITGFPVGGQAVIIINQEIRFPLRVPLAGSGLGGAFFYDGGNSFSQLSHINFRWQPPIPVFKAAYPDQNPGRFNPTQCLYNCTNELNYFSHTIGFGLRYATPVGPIRIDFGYQLNRAEFVIPCKNSSVYCQQGTRLPRFQVFFNLGSSF